jgi:RHS repeat-associated protein
LGGGVFELQEQNGLVNRFRADGRLDYLQDTNGNRITASYTGNLLTGLTHSSGQQLQLAYNAAGRLIRLTDPASGRMTVYTYDPTNEYLMSVQDPDGQVTRYTYDQGSDPLTKHALLSVAYPDGTHDYFGYDSSGHLADTHRDGSAERVVSSYDPSGPVTALDAADGTMRFYFDYRGLLAAKEDPLQRVTHFYFDNDLNLTQMIDPAGQVYSFVYDANGNLIRATDSLGNTTSYVYAGSLNRLAAVTDPNGNTTQYGYDSRGNLQSTTYADGSIESWINDPLGNPTQWTNRRDDPINYTYDSSGRLRTKKYADGSQVTYTYDNLRGNLQSTTDASGTTTFKYDDPQHLDRLTRILYPGNRSLQLQYDAAGRRTQVVDQTGFTINYAYDAVGRLDHLTDAHGNLLVRYTYDGAGRLQRKDMGNGTYTTYAYDLAGELLHLVNYAPGGTVNSRFDYTYDNLGRTTTMTTLDGQWTYQYDVIGELVHAVFTSNNPAQVPNQDLQYTYDAAGNRKSTVINGASTTYVTNNLNEYTTVGTANLVYDADGNLISQHDATGTSTYTYDDENRLVGVTGPGGTWTYLYDAFGNRVATTHNGQQTSYMVDPAGLGNVFGEYTGSGSLIDHYVYGLGLVNRTDTTGATAFYDFDALGSTADLTGTAGALLNRYSYLPFGEKFTVRETVANPFAYVGQWGVMADGHGWNFMRARFYDPFKGKFTSTDPLGITAGDTNLTRYVFNSPTAYTDPSGQIVPVLAAIALGALVGGGTDLAIQGIAIGLGYQSQVNWTSVAISAGLGGAFGGLGAYLGNTSRATGQVFSHWIPTRWAPGSWLTNPNTTLGRLNGQYVSRLFHYWTDYYATMAGLPKAAYWGQYWMERLGLNLILRLPLWLFNSLASGIINRIARSRDPNDKIGPGGFGSVHFVAQNQALSYRIDFENDATATAPAQRVDITDQLDNRLDWSTFAWSDIGFGDFVIPIPAGSQHFQTTVTMTYQGQRFQVQVELGLHSQTGQIFASFQSIDPLTSLPPNVLTGFLPPEDGTGRGMGYLSYTIRPRAGLTTGTQIRNIALVTFDLGETIATDQNDPHDPTKGTDPARQALITIDAVPPTSRVSPLPALTRTPSFLVQWSGQDDAGGSGLAFFDIYVSDNGGPFVPWLTRTAQTQAMFTGQDGHTYGFYSVATDNVGNREATPSMAQATTTLYTAHHLSVTAVPNPVPAGISFQLTVRALDINNNPATAYTGTVHLSSSQSADQLPANYTFTAADGGVHTFTITLTRAGSRTLTATDTATGTITGSTPLTVNPAAPDHFQVTTSVLTTTAGMAFDFTVTVQDAFGNTVPSYAGTVTFTSADPYGASLPGNYTFMAADQGTHTFPAGATLYTTGSWDVTATDTVRGIHGSATVAVTPAAADHFQLQAPPHHRAGRAFTLTITALDPYGNVDVNYTGTVTFSSSDPQAVLPDDTTFTSDNQGVIVLKHGATLFTAGSQTIMATDVDTGLLSGSATLTVKPAAADHFQIDAPATAGSGMAFDITVTALDPYGNIDTNYTGTVTFTSTDPDGSVVLPDDYTFTADDGGVHTFAQGVTLVTVGDQTLTVTDTMTGISGSATVTVGAPGLPPSGRNRSGVPPWEAVIQSATPRPDEALQPPILLVRPVEDGRTAARITAPGEERRQVISSRPAQGFPWTTDHVGAAAVDSVFADWEKGLPLPVLWDKELTHNV